MKNISKIILAISCQLLIVNCQLFSQTGPAIQWQNTIGGDTTENLYAISQTADGGYICGGRSLSNISGDKTETGLGSFDYWVVKLDSAGNIQWQNTIGGSGDDVLYAISQTTDRGYICGGYSNSNISFDKTENSMGNYDYWIVKLDSSGNIQWQNTIGGNMVDYLYSISQTADGGYVCGGASNSSVSGDKTENSIGFLSNPDYWVVKLDASGNIQWQNTMGGDYYDYLRCISQTADAGYICGGYSASGISGDKTENSLGNEDFWVVKIDASGSIQWENTLGGAENDQLQSISQTADGGYICGGNSTSDISGDKIENCLGLSDYWVVKLDAYGYIQWQNTIGGSGCDYQYSISQTTDGGYICGGISTSNISFDKTENSLGNYDYWIVKLDISGSIQWQNTIGGSNDDQLYSISQTADGGYICGGFSLSDISGDKTENGLGDYDYWAVKLGADAVGISDFGLKVSDVKIFPNPLVTQSRIIFTNASKEKFLFTLYDITGRITESISTTNNEIILTKGSKQRGVYLFNLINEKTGESVNGKIIVSD